MKKPLTAILVVLALAVTAGGVYWWLAGQTGTVVVNLSSTPKDLTITFNGKSIEQKSKSGSIYTFVLPQDNYLLRIKAPGYKPFSVNLQVGTGGQYRVAAQLSFLHDPTIISPGQIAGLDSGATVSDVTYFHGQSWAVIKLTTPASDPSFAAVQYSAVQNRWSIKAGPGTYFTDFSVQNLPDDVATNLTGRAQ